MKAVNLLPADRQVARRHSPLAPIAGTPVLVGSAVAAVAVLSGLGLMFHSADSSVSAKQRKLDELNAKLAATPKVPPTASSAAQHQRLVAVETIAGQRLTWDDFLGSLSRVLPEDVWLVNLQASKPVQPTAPTSTGSDSTASSGSTPTPAPSSSTAAPTAFTVTGYTYSQPSVARLMRRLALMPWLNDVSLVTSTKSTLNTTTVYQFTIGANVVTLPEVGQ
jgi:Tfp pilus assembly protein PilN